MAIINSYDIKFNMWHSLRAPQLPELPSSSIRQFSSSPILEFAISRAFYNKTKWKFTSTANKQQMLIPLPAAVQVCVCVRACVCACVCKCWCACTQRRHYIYITLCNSISYSFFTASAMNFYVQQREKKNTKLESESILFYWHIPHTVPAKSELHFDI